MDDLIDRLVRLASSGEGRSQQTARRLLAELEGLQHRADDRVLAEAESFLDQHSGFFRAAGARLHPEVSVLEALWGDDGLVLHARTRAAAGASGIEQDADGWWVLEESEAGRQRTGPFEHWTHALARARRAHMQALLDLVEPIQEEITRRDLPVSAWDILTVLAREWVRQSKQKQV